MMYKNEVTTAVGILVAIIGILTGLSAWHLAMMLLGSGLGIALIMLAIRAANALAMSIEEEFMAEPEEEESVCVKEDDENGERVEDDFNLDEIDEKLDQILALRKEVGR